MRYTPFSISCWLLCIILCSFSGCRKKENAAPASKISKIGGMRRWHGDYHYGYYALNHVGSGQTYYQGSGNITDNMELQVKSDNEVQIIHDTVLHTDTAVYELRQEDAATWHFKLTRNVTAYPNPFSPYNTFPDSIIYYVSADSIELFSRTNPQPGLSDGYIYLTTP
jgi:hypothetical protein